MTGRRWAWRSDEDPDPGRPPRRLAETLSEVASDLRMEAPDVVGAMASGWAGMVGSAVAAHTRPGTLRSGILVVEVDSPEWATQMRLLEAEVCRRIGRKTRPGVVTGLRMVVRPASEF